MLLPTALGCLQVQEASSCPSTVKHQPAGHSELRARKRTGVAGRTQIKKCVTAAPADLFLLKASSGEQ